MCKFKYVDLTSWQIGFIFFHVYQLCQEDNNYVIIYFGDFAYQSVFHIHVYRRCTLDVKRMFCVHLLVLLRLFCVCIANVLGSIANLLMQNCEDCEDCGCTTTTTTNMAQRLP